MPVPVTIMAPAKAQSSGSVAFAPSFAGSNRLTFKWEFGDGTAASAEHAHVFAKPGDYQVKLTVSDAHRATPASTSPSTTNLTCGLVCSGVDDASWCWARNLAGNGELLNSVSVNRPTAWAVGQSGALYKSVDAAVGQPGRNAPVRH